MGTNEILSEILSLDQLAKVLGYSKRQLQNYLSRNLIDYYPPAMPSKPGCARRWLRRVVEKWLSEKAELSVHPSENSEKKKRGRPRKIAA